MSRRRTAMLALLAAALALLLVVLFAGGAMLVASSGLVPIRASAGHWAITDFFLHYTMRRSVKLQSFAVQVPPLRDPALLRLGAAHYASGCAACHGAPGEPQSVVVRYQTPKAPLLAPRIAHWDANDLFWIVKHGIKFTAMPAWPSQSRDDELWAIVAFLQRLPALDAQQYREWAYGSAAAPGDAPALRQLQQRPSDPLANCVRCHGRDGLGRDGTAPVLAGQSADYLYTSLDAYAAGRRASGYMQIAAGVLDAAQMRRLAAHFAAMPAPPDAADAADADRVAAGRALARNGVPHRKLPACDGCHGADAVHRNPMYPRLAGQNRAWLAQQLRLLKAGTRGGSDYAALMRKATHRLDEKQIRALAAYYAAGGR